MKRLFLFGYLVAILVSCSDEQHFKLQTADDPDPYFISQDSAIAIADNAMAALDSVSDDIETRSLRNRTVRNVGVINTTNVQTRAAFDINSSVYVINYDDNMGFALVSSDKRLRPIYAMSNEGSFNISDTLSNQGLATFVEGMRQDIIDVSTKQPFISNSVGFKHIVNAQVPPLIWPAARKWHQQSPFNAYCPKINDTVSIVGCTAVSCAIVMSYYSWPRSIDGLYLTWRAMKKGGMNDHVAKLMRKLGEPELLDMEYGLKASAAHIPNISRTFAGMGYLMPDSFKPFSENEIRSILDDYGTPDENTGKGPMIIRGRNYAQGSSHTWVIDGYATNIVDSEEGVVNSTILFHCLWGWLDGINNGYYYLKNSKIEANTSLFDKDDAGKVSSEEVPTYSVLEYMTNFKMDKSNGNIK